MIRELRALLLPAGAYWGAVLVPLALFVGVVLWTEDTRGGALPGMAGLVLATVLGVACGQILAVLRIRTVVVLFVAVACWAVLLGLSARADATGAAREGAGAQLATMLGFFFPLFLLAGLWSLRAHTALLAAWAPLVYVSACILVVAEHTGGAARWHAGDKWAIWDAFSAPVLVLGVVLLLVFLAAREVHRLRRWRATSGGAPWAHVLPGVGSLVALVALGVVLSAGSALVAPYLWRTGPGDRPGAAASGAEEQAAAEADGAGSEARRRVERAARHAASAMFLLLLLLVLVLVATVVFGPPVARTLLLQHLRRPLFPVPPTRQVQHAWRLVEIALADHGIVRLPGDTAARLAERASAVLPDVDAEPIRTCAAIADRVTYGIALRPDDTMWARRTAEMAYQALWGRLDEWQKLRAAYRTP